MIIISENEADNEIVEAVKDTIAKEYQPEKLSARSAEDAMALTVWTVEDIRTLCRRYGIRMKVSDMTALLHSIEDDMRCSMISSGWKVLVSNFELCNELIGAEIDYDADGDFSIETDLPEDALGICSSCNKVTYNDKYPEVVFSDSDTIICEECSIDYEQDAEGKIHLRKGNECE